MDAGCEYHGYVSDVTRTWPVNGTFSSAQRDLYEIVRTTKQELTQVSEWWDGIHTPTRHLLAAVMVHMCISCVGLESHSIPFTLQQMAS